jgi:hypothetical protein
MESYFHTFSSKINNQFHPVQYSVKVVVPCSGECMSRLHASTTVGHDTPSSTKYSSLGRDTHYSIEKEAIRLIKFQRPIDHNRAICLDYSEKYLASDSYIHIWKLPRHYLQLHIFYCSLKRYLEHCEDYDSTYPVHIAYFHFCRAISIDDTSSPTKCSSVGCDTNYSIEKEAIRLIKFQRPIDHNRAICLELLLS